MTIIEIVFALVSSLFIIIWFFVKLQITRMQKDIDETNALIKKCGTKEEVDLLFKKHDFDVADLANVKLTLAGKHYERTELDLKFDKLDQTIKNGFRELSTDLKEMTTSINETYKDHIKTHHTD